jgi:hypothetical protein
MAPTNGQTHRVERLYSEASGIHQNPSPKPEDMHIHKHHAPGKRGDDIGDPALQAALTCRLIRV